MQADNLQIISTPHSANTSISPTTLPTFANALPEETCQRWTTLQAQNNFEVVKAESSCLALPYNLHRIKPATIEQAMSDVFPTIATVGKYHGKAQAKAAVSEMIAQAAALLNVGKNIQPHQIGFLADDIQREYYFLTIGEIRYIMERGIRGEYGTSYDRIDAQTVSEWIENYLAIRGEIAAQRAQRAQAQADHEEREATKGKQYGPPPPGVVEAMRNLQAKFIEVEKPEFEADAVTLEMIRQEYAGLIDPSLSLEKFTDMRIAQLKAMLRK